MFCNSMSRIENNNKLQLISIEVFLYNKRGDAMKKIIICPNEEKLNILEKIEDNNKLHSIKFMTINEYINNYYFSYDTKTIYYLMKKYNFNIDVVKVYLKNLYYIDEHKEYKNKKLLFLKNIKKELIDNNLLYFNNIFKYYIKDKSIEVINYYNLEKYIEKDLNFTTKIADYNLNKQVHEFNSIEEEVEFVCIEIRKLLDRGIDINNIYLVNISEEYNYIISKLFSYYNIPINILFKDSIYGTNIVNDFLKLKTIDLNNSNKSIINKKIINILEELVDIDSSDPIYNKILIDKLKNTYLNNKKLDKAVNTKELDSYTFSDKDYVFCLGFNLDSLPKTFKDIEFLSDMDKKEVDLYDTTYLNKREKNKVIYLLSRIKNLTISYKLSSPFQKYYPSNLISDLNMEIIKENKRNLEYSNTYNKILLGEYLDKYNLYGEVDPNLTILNSNYDIKYNSYNNKYMSINKDIYLENISYPLRLSYTAINNYNECKFKYYINNVLKINDYTDTFQAFIGQIYHYILTLYKRNNFNIDEEFNNYLKERELSLKEKVLLVKIKKDLIDLIEILKRQQLLTGYDEELYEKKVVIPIRNDIKVEFIGYIDKIMYYKNMDDTYFSIIDYKTGSIDTNIELMKYGLHMQLPTYLYLINYGDIISNPIFTGIYYQNILFNYPTWKKNIEKEINDRYLLKGYSTDNIEILEKFDSTYENSEYIKSMKYNSDKGFGTYAKIINDEEMLNMIKFVNSHIKEKTNEILDRDFEINPKIYEGKNISCKFCTFKDLCFMRNDDLRYLEKVDDLSFLGGEA